jgi:hypothetical protein
MEAMAASGTHSTQLVAIERNAAGLVEVIHLAVTLRPGNDTSNERELLGVLIEELEADGEHYLQGRLAALISELLGQDTGQEP